MPNFAKMGKKIFVRRARVVEGERWHIDFITTNAMTGTETRHRPDFDLNSIADLEVRRLVATHIAARIENFLVYVVEGDSSMAAPKTCSLAAAIKIMREEKTQSKRKDSNKNYKTICDRLLMWAKDGGFAVLPVEEFKTTHAKRFKKYLISLGLSGRTVNNYIACLVTLWNALPQSVHEIQVANPFARMPKERVAKKKRRTYTKEEKLVVVRYIQENHYWLYRALLLLYYCGIRRNEMCRLRFGDFDLKTGLIHISDDAAKTYRGRTPTIPLAILPAFQDGKFDKFPKKCYVFGKEWVPNPDEPLNPNRISKTHRRLLEGATALIPDFDLSGLDFYAWKDTAISTHIHITTPIATRDQFGHQRLEQTMVYYHAPLINEEYRDLPDTLHGQ